MTQVLSRIAVSRATSRLSLLLHSEVEAVMQSETANERPSINDYSLEAGRYKLW